MYKKIARYLAVGFVGFSFILLSGSLVAGTQKKVIEGWTLTKPPEANPFNRKAWDILDKFEEEHPNIKVHIETYPWNEYQKKLLLACATKTEPDIFYVDYSFFFQLAQAGYMLKLDKYVSYDLYNKYYPFTWGKLDGSLYGFPHKIFVGFLRYRKDILAEAGYANPPKTWDELYEIGSKATVRKDDKYERFGYAIATPSPELDERWLSAVYQNGGKILEEGFTRVAFNTPAGVGALQHFVDLIHKYKVCPLGAQPTDEMFIAGRIAMEESGVWALQRLWKSEEIKGKWGISFSPYNKTPTTWTEWKVFGISPRSKYPEESLEFLKFAHNKEHLIEATWRIPHIPPMKGLLDEPELKDHFDERPGLKEVLEVSQIRPHFVPYIPEWETAGKEFFNDLIYRALLGKVSPEEAIAKAASEFDKLLVKYRK